MKFKKKPNIQSAAEIIDKQKLTDKILAEADQSFSSIQQTDDKTKPWAYIGIEKDTIVFSFRIPKKDMQQLKYISKITGMSLNALCLRAIQVNNKKMIKEIDCS